MTSQADPKEYCPEQVAGLILCGGAGRRMGGTDKGLLELDGRPLVQWVADVLRPQVASLLISANRNQARYAALGWPVFPDAIAVAQGAEPQAFPGPLAGIATALARIQAQTQAQQQADPSLPAPSPMEASLKIVATPAWLLVSPCDTPLIPTDLGPRLARALEAEQARIAIAVDHERSQPLHALIPTDLGPDLQRYLESGRSSVLGWLDRHQVATARFEQLPSPFSNLNQLADAELVRAQIRMPRSAMPG